MSILLSEISGGVARLTLNRPAKRNALTRELIEQMLTSVREIRDDTSVRLLIVTGSGPVFCAGMDLGEMEARAGSANARDEWQQDTVVYRDLLWELFTLPIPTLLIAQGPALAGGLGVLLACDMVLSAEESFFSLPEPKRGITAAVVAPLLAYRIGPGQAGYLLLSGRSLSAVDAQRVGLVHEIASHATLDDQERALTSTILTGSPVALAETKRHLLRGPGAELTEWLDSGMQVSATARETADAREGLAAFLEKRDPLWFPGEQ